MHLVEADLAVIGRLKANRANLVKPRHTLFYLYFQNGVQANNAKSAIAQSFLSNETDFAVTILPPEQSDEWLCIIEAQMVVDEKTIAQSRAVLEQICSQFQGEYDGWEASTKP